MNISGHDQSIALSDISGRILTHAAFEHSINFCKVLLSNNGISHNSRVLLLLEKNFLSVTLIHAISDLHATYIPVDPTWPENRISSIVNDCQPHFVLHGSEEFLNSFPGKKIEIPECGEVVLSKPQNQSKPEYPITENSAYILYTSGSTGKPKGVCVSRAAMTAFTQWCVTAFQINSNDVIASIAPILFDLSICDIFASRAVGCALHLFRKQDISNPRLMTQELIERNITFIYATPTFLSSLVHYGKMDRQKNNSITRVLFAGEVFAVKPLHQLMDVWNEAKFYNLYGPTETNVCTYTEIKKDPERIAPYPIGKVCPGHEMYIEPDGELVVSGPHLASGYLNLEALTKERFITKQGKIWFKTGDIVEKISGEELNFKGRKDRMIKRRGYRIEPGEIEAMAMHIENVKNAACVADKNAENEVRITLFLEGVQQEKEMDLRLKLAGVLAESMLPDRIIAVENFPVTSTGKTDYLALTEYVKQITTNR